METQVTDVSTPRSLIEVRCITNPVLYYRLNCTQGGFPKQCSASDLLNVLNSFSFYSCKTDQDCIGMLIFLLKIRNSFENLQSDNLFYT